MLFYFSVERKAVTMRRDVKRNCILIFLYVHNISHLSFLTFKKNNEM